MTERSAHSPIFRWRQGFFLLALVMVVFVLNLLSQTHLASLDLPLHPAPELSKGVAERMLAFFVNWSTASLTAFRSRYNEWLRYCQGAFYCNANLPRIAGFCLIFLAVDYLACILALYWNGRKIGNCLSGCFTSACPTAPGRVVAAPGGGLVPWARVERKATVALSPQPSQG
jgi:hypothetical protein